MDDSNRAGEPQDIQRLLARSNGGGLSYRRFSEAIPAVQQTDARPAAPAGSAAALFPLLAEALPECANIPAGAASSPDAAAPAPVFSEAPPAPIAPPVAPQAMPAALPPQPVAPPIPAPVPAPAPAAAPVAPPMPQPARIAAPPAFPGAPPTAGGTRLDSVFRLLGARPSAPHNPFGRR
jgi:hypothetical protein